MAVKWLNLDDAVLVNLGQVTSIEVLPSQEDEEGEEEGLLQIALSETASGIDLAVAHFPSFEDANALSPMIVVGTLGIAGAILTEATLSFLGLGIQQPIPSWGTMVYTGQNYIFTAWWYAVFPGLAIMLTVLGFNFVGDALRDALDPNRVTQQT